MQTAKVVNDALLFPGSIQKGTAYKRLFQDLFAAPEDALGAHMNRVLDTWESVVRSKGSQATVEGLYLASELLNSLAKSIPETFPTQIDRTNSIQDLIIQTIDSKALPRRLPQRAPGMQRGCLMLQSANARHQFLAKMAPAFAALGFETHEYVFGHALINPGGNSFVLLIDPTSNHAVGSLYFADTKTLLVFNTWTMDESFVTYVLDTMVLVLPIDNAFFFPNQGTLNLQDRDVERFGMGQCIDWAILLSYLAARSFPDYTPDVDISPQVAVLYDRLQGMSLQQINSLQAEIGFFGGRSRGRHLQSSPRTTEEGFHRI
jgi:hypothetical protein